jgi:ABC-type branched-subunit amino acid transport system ATPase component
MSGRGKRHGLVPQGREIFPLLTVEENLKTGFAPLKRDDRTIPDDVFSLFPVLNTMLGGAAAICPAASSSSSPSAARW